jgi:hypothetical protein
VTDIVSQLPSFVEAMDQPSVDGVNTYLVSKVARDLGIPVALSGLGGDEAFGGYERYRALSDSLRIRHLPQTAEGERQTSPITQFEEQGLTLFILRLSVRVIALIVCHFPQSPEHGGDAMFVTEFPIQRQPFLRQRARPFVVALANSHCRQIPERPGNFSLVPYLPKQSEAFADEARRFFIVIPSRGREASGPSP